VRITGVDCHVLLVHDVRTDAASSAQDDFVVEIHTDEGITGIGESDLNPWIARACLEAPSTHNMGMSLREMLIGEDPLDPPRLWDKLYVGSAMNGRRGAVVHTMGAIDIALWDIAGKAAGKPIYELLGGAVRDQIVPYASLQPDVRGFESYRDSLVRWAVRAKEDYGFRAAKLEIVFDGPYAHLGTREPDSRVIEVVDAVRQAVGGDMTLMVDVAYAWNDPERAIRTIRALRDYDLFFFETPLWSDDLPGYARLHDADVGTRIAAGEWLATRYEFIELMERGKVEVVQPDIGRVGGLSEARRVAELAAEWGRIVVPHAWKTAVSIAAAAHFAAATEGCAFIEFLPKELTDSALRSQLTVGELEMHDGVVSLPTAAGLGVELDREALARFEVDS
jgi:L-alanine-DL-glutamate epimerase-like enolase superfamily enzyme